MKSFEISTESDARVLERGETVALARGGHITPLAQDTLNERRVTVVRADRVSEEDASLAPPADIRSVAIGSDHTGIELRKTLISYLGGAWLSTTSGRTRPTPSIILTSQRPLATPLPTARPTPASSSTERASGRRLRRTRSAGSAP